MDLHNEPLDPQEFMAIPYKIIKEETFQPIYSGVIHKEIVENDWDDPDISIYPDNKIKLLGFLGKKTGIRLNKDCEEVLEDE